MVLLVLASGLLAYELTPFVLAPMIFLVFADALTPVVRLALTILLVFAGVLTPMVLLVLADALVVGLLFVLLYRPSAVVRTVFEDALAVAVLSVLLK